MRRVSRFFAIVAMACVWGLTASDGPADVTHTVNGVPRRFFTYAARGASYTEVRDDGTLAPTASVL